MTKNFSFIKYFILWKFGFGETIANLQGIMQGQMDGELTELGKLQAKLLGLRLSKVKFDDIYCSDLGRTKQTLNEIYPFHNGTNVLYEKKIREKCGGILEGRSIIEVKKIAEKKNIPMRKFRPFEGENWIDVYNRSQEFLNDIIVKYININFHCNEQINFKNLNSKDKLIEEEIKLNNAISSNFEEKKIQKEIKNFHLNKNESNLIPSKNKHLKEKIVLFIFNKNLEKSLQIISDPSSIKKIYVPFNGFINETENKRILVVTHGGFIMETINAIRTKTNKELRFANDAINTGLYVLKIYCELCGLACKSNQNCKLNFDFLLFNNSSHLEFLVKDY